MDQIDSASALHATVSRSIFWGLMEIAFNKRREWQTEYTLKQLYLRNVGGRALILLAPPFLQCLQTNAQW